MDLKVNNNNIINVRTLANGSDIYIVNLGTVIYNDRLVNLNNLIIPLSDQTFFNLPQDANKYAIVNIYYNIERAEFIFDKVGVFPKKIDKVSFTALFNALPIAQFVLKQDHQSFLVDHYNEYSQMATFSISSNLVKGAEGERGSLGWTGDVGLTGIQGPTGNLGYGGVTGVQGPTGVGEMGFSGIQGDTGYYPDKHLLFYLKFKSEDYIQTDYSIYERDVTWGISGGDSSVTREEGPVDYCHNIHYGGGYSAYKRNIFLPFGETGGNISAWIKLDSAPIADFTFELIDGVKRIYKFIDNSFYFPDRWEWDFGDGAIGTGETIYHRFNADGEYIIKLTAINDTGSSIKYKLLTISGEEAWDMIVEV